MTFRLAAVTLAVLALGDARADDGFGLKFSGFGTLSAVHANERQADFVNSSFQPSGAGYTRSVSLDPDSKLAGQVDAKFNDSFSAVLQVVSQHQYDNSYRPQIEWANVKYQITPAFSVRLGRIALPGAMISDSRLVGYANPWVRPPTEVYGTVPVTSNNGVDASYRGTAFGANSSFQAFYGKATAKIPGGITAKTTSNWGFNDSLEIGSWTLRAGVTSSNLALTVPALDGLFGGLDQFAAGAGAVPVPAFQAAAAQARALLQKYSFEDVHSKYYALGAVYDPGNWFVMGEFVAARTAGFLADANSWYVSGGYRFGSFTPYAVYSTVKSKVKDEPGISTVGADALAPAAAMLNGGLNATLAAYAATQNTVAVGLRWDFMTNFALKTQFERLSLGQNSSGRLGNLQPGFVPGGKVNVVTVALDFVF